MHTWNVLHWGEPITKRQEVWETQVEWWFPTVVAQADFQYGCQPGDIWKILTKYSTGQEISSYHRKFITHFYSKLVVVDFDILCSPFFILHFNSNHYRPPFVTIPIFHCCSFMYISVAQYVLSVYEITESDLSVAGRSVLKMPLNCEM